MEELTQGQIIVAVITVALFLFGILGIAIWYFKEVFGKE
jgi:hypothetical protein